MVLKIWRSEFMASHEVEGVKMYLYLENTMAMVFISTI
jgi:hypothetical protein